MVRTRRPRTAYSSAVRLRISLFGITDIFKFATPKQDVTIRH